MVVTAHLGPTTAGRIFTVYITGSNATWSGGSINGMWTVRAINSTSFTLPFRITGAATVQGTCTVLNQNFAQGRLTTSTIVAPTQAIQHRVNRVGHGYETNDFVHFYAAQGFHATSINDLVTSSSANRLPSQITKVNDDIFTCERQVTGIDSQPTVATAGISTISTAMSSATVVTSAAHGLVTGDVVTITGCTGAAVGYNGSWLVAVINATTFTFTAGVAMNGIAQAGSPIFWPAPITLTAQPQMRSAPSGTVYHTIQKMRARGVCVSVQGMNGI
jgi:hypothetical protein